MRKYSQAMARHTLSELNVTPLLDLAFTLLIIFMITTPLIEGRMQIDLPEDKRDTTPQTVEASSVRQVNVDARGNIYLENQPVSLSQLESSLKRLKAADPDTTAALRADESLRYERIVEVLGAIRNAGIKLALGTSQE